MENKKTGKHKIIPFGDIRYQQYKDQTGLGLYSDKDHGDPKRRQSYRKRHEGEQNHMFSSGYFSFYYLW